jgi:hypothetical protein
LQKLRAAGLHIEATTDIITILNGNLVACTNSSNKIHRSASLI